MSIASPVSPENASDSARLLRNERIAGVVQQTFAVDLLRLALLAGQVERHAQSYVRPVIARLGGDRGAQLGSGEIRPVHRQQHPPQTEPSLDVVRREHHRLAVEL